MRISFNYAPYTKEELEWAKCFRIHGYSIRYLEYLKSRHTYFGRGADIEINRIRNELSDGKDIKSVISRSVKTEMPKSIKELQ